MNPPWYVSAIDWLFGGSLDDLWWSNELTSGHNEIRTVVTYEQCELQHDSRVAERRDEEYTERGKVIRKGSREYNHLEAAFEIIRKTKRDSSMLYAHAVQMALEEGRAIVSKNESSWARPFWHTVGFMDATIDPYRGDAVLFQRKWEKWQVR